MIDGLWINYRGIQCYLKRMAYILFGCSTFLYGFSSPSTTQFLVCFCYTPCPAVCLRQRLIHHRVAITTVSRAQLVVLCSSNCLYHDNFSDS
ncbi:hypothetical protein BJX65DRAFT_112001 [Aspergillus insuetus]